MSFIAKNFVASLIIGVGLSGCVEQSGGGAVVSASQNRQVTIVNNTGRSIWRVYGSRTSTNSWEEDILGSDVLSNGQSVNINFDDGTGACMFDMKAEFENGSSTIIEDVNVCTASAVTFN